MSEMVGELYGLALGFGILRPCSDQVAREHMSKARLHTLYEDMCDNTNIKHTHVWFHIATGEVSASFLGYQLLVLLHVGVRYCSMGGATFEEPLRQHRVYARGLCNFWALLTQP